MEKQEVLINVDPDGHGSVRLSIWGGSTLGLSVEAARELAAKLLMASEFSMLGTVETTAWVTPKEAK